MIKINLLPFRVARKKENIRKQISIFLLFVLLTGVALIWYTQSINKQIVSIKEKTKQINYQVAKYKEKVDRVVQIQKDLKILKEKLVIISSLKEQKKKQLMLFDGMTDLIIPTRMWLESFKTDKNSVTIKGIAFDNPTPRFVSAINSIIAIPNPFQLIVFAYVNQFSLTISFTTLIN